MKSIVIIIKLFALLLALSNYSKANTEIQRILDEREKAAKILIPKVKHDIIELTKSDHVNDSINIFIDIDMILVVKPEFIEISDSATAEFSFLKDGSHHFGKLANVNSRADYYYLEIDTNPCSNNSCNVYDSDSSILETVYLNPDPNQSYGGMSRYSLVSIYVDRSKIRTKEKFNDYLSNSSDYPTFLFAPSNSSAYITEPIAMINNRFYCMTKLRKKYPYRQFKKQIDFFEIELSEFELGHCIKSGYFKKH